MELTNQLILLAGLLFIGSILATVITPRLGVPILFVFLVVGMLAGEDGPGGIAFGNYSLANLAGTAALAVILFDGGLRTRFAAFRVGLKPALSLATVGVLITTALIGAFSAWLMKLSWAEGLLIGAIVGSTDAAAVFSLLHTKAVHLNERVSSALEIESGANDPVAVFLTLAVLEYLLAPERYRFTDSLWLLAMQMGLGTALGVGGGRLLVTALNRVVIAPPLYPLLALFGGLLIFGFTATLGGSGFLAAYLAGLIAGNRRVTMAAAIRRFHDGVAWMAQIGMFVILGLLATPSRLVPLILPGLAIALALMLVARPLAVAVSLAPFRFPLREQAYIAWVGLRGSVPIVLATYPLLAGLPNAQLFFDIAFFIVLVSLLVQGSTVALAASGLGLQLPMRGALVHRLDFDLPGTLGYEIVSYKIGEASSLIGRRSKELPLTDVSRIICIARRGKVISYRDWGALRSGDYIALLASQDELPQLDAIFQSASLPSPKLEVEQIRYFGEFGINLDAPATALAEIYGLELPASAEGRDIVEFFMAVIPKPVVGDRLRLGELELIVKRMDGNRVAELGLRLPH